MPEPGGVGEGPGDGGFGFSDDDNGGSDFTFGGGFVIEQSGGALTPVGVPSDVYYDPEGTYQQHLGETYTPPSKTAQKIGGTIGGWAGGLIGTFFGGPAAPATGPLLAAGGKLAGSQIGAGGWTPIDAPDAGEINDNADGTNYATVDDFDLGPVTLADYDAPPEERPSAPGGDTLTSGDVPALVGLGMIGVVALAIVT